jgi:glycosyltransferase involved in cell wall biosynthesis
MLIGRIMPKWSASRQTQFERFDLPEPFDPPQAIPIVDFSIITPSFRSAKWLPLCIHSIADQEVGLEHIVQDSCSDDGTRELLAKEASVKAYIEKDAGMYDAVNRGFRRASAPLLAYLNCDEQYLPDALRQVSRYFKAHPEVDVVFGDVIVVNGDGSFNCYRKVQIPLKYHTWVSGNLATFTAATFIRRTVLEKHNLYFDTRFRDLGDVDWMMRALKAGLRMALLRRYTSVFTETGVNMNQGANAAREKKDFFGSAPKWAQRAAPLFVLQHRLRRLLQGAYHQPPFSYSIYTSGQPDKRTTFNVPNPTARWIR